MAINGLRMDSCRKHDFEKIFINDVLEMSTFWVIRKKNPEEKIGLCYYKLYHFNRNKYKIHSPLFLGLKKVQNFRYWLKKLSICMLNRKLNIMLKTLCVQEHEAAYYVAFKILIVTSALQQIFQSEIYFAVYGTREKYTIPCIEIPKENGISQS